MSKLFSVFFAAAFLFLSFSPASADMINPEQAKQIALTHANLSESETGHIKIDQDYDDGILLFEVEFWSKNIEYEYKISAEKGKILEYGQERNRVDFTPISPNQELLSAEQAKEIAAAHAQKKTSEVRFVKIAQEFKHGYSSYELKFWYDYVEYKYEIDAANGEILEFSVKFFN